MIEPEEMATYPRHEALISPPQLADYLGVPLSTLYNWRSRRIGPPAYRIGRHVRFRRQDIEAWLENLRDDRAEQADWPAGGEQ